MGNGVVKKILISSGGPGSNGNNGNYWIYDDANTHNVYTVDVSNRPNYKDLTINNFGFETKVTLEDGYGSSDEGDMYSYRHECSYNSSNGILTIEQFVHYQLNGRCHIPLNVYLYTAYE